MAEWDMSPGLSQSLAMLYYIVLLLKIYSINFIVYSKCKINLTKEKEHIKAKIPPGVSYMANLCSPKD